MKDLFLNSLQKNWKKPRSIPVALLLLVMAYVALVSAVGGWDGVTLTTKIYIIIAAVFLLAWLVYCIVCLAAYCLPRAPKGYLAVLFCIDAESDKLFAAARKKLVENFRASLAHNADIQLKELCVSKDRLSRYDLRQDADILRLLKNTGAVIFIDVHYSADDTEDSGNFSLKIHYGISHPGFSETANKALKTDIVRIGAPLKNRRFEKKETIDVFEFSTQALVFACQYIIGFVLLLTGDGANAIKLLTQARETAMRNGSGGFNVKNMTRLVDERLYLAYHRAASTRLKHFQRDHSPEHLHDVESMLEQANHIHPDTYSYNLLKAYVLVMLHHDIATAKKCIEKCKNLNHGQAWRFSDAFLSAYNGNSPGSTLSKYRKAFKESPENLVELADFIEVVHEQEPEKENLLLALGLIYNQMGNHIQANYHLSLFLDRSKNLDRRDREKIEALIQNAPCNANCHHNCCSCDALEVG